MSVFTKSKFALFLLAGLFANIAQAEISAGDTLQTLVNLHPDAGKSVLYSINYQLRGLIIPACSEITVTKVKKKKISFEWRGRPFQFVWEKHTRGAGVSLAASADDFFGAKCDSAKMDALGDIDKEGIKKGIAIKGMTRDGVLFAMGRPPHHVNPFLDTSSWTYWKNRFSKTIITFGDDGKVEGIQ